MMDPVSISSECYRIALLECLERRHDEHNFYLWKVIIECQSKRGSILQSPGQARVGLLRTNCFLSRSTKKSGKVYNA